MPRLRTSGMFVSSPGYAPTASSCGAVIGRRRQERHVRRRSHSVQQFHSAGSVKNTTTTAPTTASDGSRRTAAGPVTAAARRRRVVCAAEGGSGGGGGDAGGSPPSAADALAERMAKAKAYKEQREKEAATMDGNAELESIVQEAMARLDKSSEKSAAPIEPEGPREVRVKIMTRDKNYNPFGEDERAVGVEQGDEVFKPEVGGWGGEQTLSLIHI